MFTGLVADLGEVKEVEQTGEGVVLTIASRLTGEIAPGDSVAVNGVCLTATSVFDERFTADVMNQTVSATSMAGLRAGQHVNLELPLRPADRLGGHFVQGHVDGIGTVAGRARGRLCPPRADRCAG